MALTAAGLGCGTSISGAGSQLCLGPACSLNGPLNVSAISLNLYAHTADPAMLFLK